MAITTGSEIKAVGEFTNEYSDENILLEIDIVEAELYEKYSLPKRASFSIDGDYTDFFINKSPVYNITRLQVGVETSIDPSGYLIIGSDTNWSHTPNNNYITLESSFISTYDTKQIRVQYIPKIFNLLASNIAALNLIAPTTITRGEATIEAPRITQIKDRIMRYKNLLKPKVSSYSSKQVDYEPLDYISLSQTDYR